MAIVFYQARIFFCNCNQTLLYFRVLRNMEIDTFTLLNKKAKKLNANFCLNTKIPYMLIVFFLVALVEKPEVT